MLIPAVRLLKSIHARRTAVLISALIAVSSAQAQPAVAGTMPEDYLPGLKPILEAALLQSPQSIQASLVLLQADAAKLNAMSGRLPTLQATGSYGGSTASSESSGLKSTSTSSGAYYGLSLGQPVFEFGAINARVDIGKISQQIAERQYDEAYRNLALTIRRGYLDLISRKTALRFARVVLQQKQDALAVVQQRVQTNAAAQGDINEPRIQVSEAQVGVQRSEFALDYVRRIFVRLTGLQALADSEIPDALRRPADASGNTDVLFTAFTGGGIEATNQARILSLSIKQSDLTLLVANRQQWPKFALGAGTGLSNNTSASVDSAGKPSVSQAAVNSSNVNLGVNWNWFDGFRTRAEKIRAAAAKRSSELQLKNFLATTTDQAADLRAQIKIAFSELAIVEERLNLVRSQLEIVTARDTVDVIAAVQGNVNAAELRTLDQRATCLNLWSEYVSLVGADPVMKNIPTNRGR